MTILRLTSAALIAAGLGFAGAANAAPAANLSGDQQATQRDDSAATPVHYRRYGHYGYYPGYYGYYPRYRYYQPYYYQPYYGYPYGYYGGPSFNFGIHIR